MANIINIIGNGKSAGLFDPNTKEVTYTCNLPPISIPHAKATFMVDFKMMRAIHAGEVQVPGNWILGARPKKYCSDFPAFYLKHSPQIKQFYTDLPEYAENYTNFNCGHMATRYCASMGWASDIHMYGFDSMFVSDLTSCTDMYLVSDRSVNNTVRLTNIWRPMWYNIFKEFSNITFHLHYPRKAEFALGETPKNVKIVIGK